MKQYSLLTALLVLASEAWVFGDLNVSSETKFILLGQSGVGVDRERLVIGGGIGADVYVRDGTNWVKEIRLTVPGLPVNDDFVWAAGIASNVVVLGYPRAQSYVFEKLESGWTEGVPLGGPGYSVGVTTNRIIAGSFGGGASVVGRTNATTAWFPLANLSEPTAPQSYGQSVALAGQLIAVGAPANCGTGNTGAGAAYIYRYDGLSFVREAELHAGDEENCNEFGSSVATDGKVVFVGARFATPTTTNVSHGGAAYLFTQIGTNWVQQAKLEAHDARPNAQFGKSMALSARSLIVGAATDSTNGMNNGSAYIFTCRGTNWIESAKLMPSGSHIFGFTVATDGKTFAVGTPNQDEAYAYEVGGLGQPPVAICQNALAPFDSACVTELTADMFDANSYDPDGVIYSRSLTIVGTNITLTVVDNDGLSNSCSATFSSIDLTPPTITCPDSITTNVPLGVQEITLNYPEPLVADNCGTVSIACTPVSGSAFPVGTTPVTCVATDTAGLTNACTFDVTVNSPVHDLAIVSVKSPKRIRLRSDKGPVSKSIKVRLQNLDSQPVTLTSYTGFPNLIVESLGATCPNLPVTLHAGSLNAVLPVTIRPQGKLKVVFDVEFDCANDPEKGEPHADYRVYATLASAGDTVPANDACPRPPSDSDKGCGTDDGADIVIDVVVD